MLATLGLIGCSVILFLLLVLFFLFASDVALHALHAEDHEDADADHDVHEDDLEVDPL